MKRAFLTLDGSQCAYLQANTWKRYHFTYNLLSYLSLLIGHERNIVLHNILFGSIRSLNILIGNEQRSSYR